MSEKLINLKLEHLLHKLTKKILRKKKHLRLEGDAANQEARKALLKAANQEARKALLEKLTDVRARRGKGKDLNQINKLEEKIKKVGSLNKKSAHERPHHLATSFETIQDFLLAFEELGVHIDSVKDVFTLRGPDDWVRLGGLVRHDEVYTSYKDEIDTPYDKAEAEAQDLLNQGDPKEKPRAHHRIGLTYLRRGQLDEAEEHFKHAYTAHKKNNGRSWEENSGEQLSRRLELLVKGGTYDGLAPLFEAAVIRRRKGYVGEAETACEAILGALVDRESERASLLEARTLYELAHCKITRGSYHDARELLFRARRLSAEGKEKNAEAEALLALGFIETHTGDYTRAARHFGDARKKGDTRLAAYADLGRGNLQRLRARSDLAQRDELHSEAKRSIDGARATLKRLDDRVGYASGLYELGRLQRDQKRKPNRALTAAEWILEESQDTTIMGYVCVTLGTWSDPHEVYTQEWSEANILTSLDHYERALSYFGDTDLRGRLLAGMRAARLQRDLGNDKVVRKTLGFLEPSDRDAFDPTPLGPLSVLITAAAHRVLGNAHQNLGDRDQAEAHYQRARRLYRVTNDLSGLGYSLLALCGLSADSMSHDVPRHSSDAYANLDAAEALFKDKDAVSDRHTAAKGKVLCHYYHARIAYERSEQETDAKRRKDALNAALSNIDHAVNMIDEDENLPVAKDERLNGYFYYLRAQVQRRLENSRGSSGDIETAKEHFEKCGDGRGKKLVEKFKAIK